jgi:urease beta subunit
MNFMKAVACGGVILTMLLSAGCAKKQLPEAKVKGLAKFQINGGAPISQASSDEYNPYVIQMSNNYLVLVFGSNRACGTCTGHNLFVARSVGPYNNDAVFPAFENPTVLTIGGTPLNYAARIQFAAAATGNNVRIFLTNTGGNVQQTGAIVPTGPYDTTLTNIANVAGLASTVLGVEITGNRLYARQGTTLYSINHASAGDPLAAMATGQSATSVANLDGAFTSRSDGFFSLIDGTITSMSLYGNGGNLVSVNNAIAKGRITPRQVTVMGGLGGGFNGALMFVSGVEVGGSSEDMYVVDGLTVWEMWQQVNPKPPGPPNTGAAETAAAAPAFSPTASPYGGFLNLSITSTTIAATICYTTNGVDPDCNTTPTCTTGTLYSGAVNLGYYTGTAKAIACKSGLTKSAVVSSAYVSDNIQPTAPTSPFADGVSSSAIDLTWVAGSDNLTTTPNLVYEICQTTTSGNCAFATFSATYTTTAGATAFSATGLSPATTYYFTMRTRDEAGNTSGVPAQFSAMTAAAPTVNAPTFSPVAGLYNASQNVTISTTTGSALICYTTDGNTPACNATPACTTGSAYGGTVNISATSQLRAIGCRSGYTNSSVTSGTYTIDTVAPVISAVSPATNDSPVNTQVSFTFSEACASGNVTWTRTGGTADGGSPHVRSLVGSELTSGAHNNITLTNNPTLVSGAIYSVAFNCTDAAGNAATTITSTNVTHNAPTGPPRLMETNGTVNAMVLNGTTLYVGGNFTYVGAATGSGATINTSNGAISSSVTTILNMASQIMAAAPDGSGGWYIGGTFTTIGGVARNRIARINADGTLNAWNPDANNQVVTLVVSGGIVYAGGDFTTIGGQARNRIAALDGTTGAATAWNANANLPISTLALSGSGTTLYAGGQFTSIGGQARNRIAEVNISDGLATAWNPNANNVVSAIAVSGATVYVGGSFSNIGGQARNAIAAILVSDGTATSWSPGAVGGGVSAIAVSGTTIYVGGGFIFAGGLARNRIAALDAASNTALAWNPNANNAVSTLAVSGSNVYAGGSFTSIGGQTRNRIAAIDTSAGTATAWDPNPAGNAVNVITLSGSVMFVGGFYTHMSGQLRNRIAAIDTSTGNVRSWNPNISSGGAVVNALAFSGTTVYAGGTFTTVGGQARNNIVALDATAGTVTAWNPNSGAGVNALAISGSGSVVYVGGNFTTIGGQTRNRIAAIDATTGTATAWNPGADNNVAALAVSGSTIYAGGSFSAIGGQTRWYLGAVDDTTGAATTWNKNANNPVKCLAVSGSTLYVGGGFTTVAGNSRVGGAAFDTGTGNITSWWPATLGSFASIYAIAASGSTVYIGGDFTTAGAQVRNNIAAVDEVNGSATAWNPNADQAINSLVVSGTIIYAGGNFTTINGQPRGYLTSINSVTGAPY